MSSYLLLIPILLPVIGGLLLFKMPGLSKTVNRRNIYVLAVLLISSFFGVRESIIAEGSAFIFSISKKAEIVLWTDGFSVLFAALMSLIWIAVGIYAFEYMEHDEESNRFFAFYLMLMGSLYGIYMSGNIVTLYMFYEIMTLVSFPLVLHSRTEESIKAAYKYLFYSIGGAFLSLIAIFGIYHYADATAFTAGGILNGLVSGPESDVIRIFTLLAIIGFGSKAGLFPLHGWLPTAHPVAPAPASAVLSGIITKSGVFAILRLIFFTVGADMIKGTWVQYVFIILTLVTVFMGSMMAYMEKQFKKRLAFSSVSQVSYVLFGIATLHPIGMLGALLHVVFHSLIKNTLFMNAGSIIHHAGITEVDGLKGIGKKMPVTMWCFALVSLGLIGIPPMSGFISKWYLATGALSAGLDAYGYIGAAILLVSALLTAGYLLDIVVHGFFPGSDFDYGSLQKCEAGYRMLIPVICLTFGAVILGIFPGTLTSFIEGLVGMLGL